MASAQLKDPPVAGQDVQGDIINHGSRPLRALWRQCRQVHWLALHQQLTMDVARLALIDVAVEHEIFLCYQATQLLVSYRGRQHVEGRVGEPGSQPTPRA